MSVTSRTSSSVIPVTILVPSVRTDVKGRKVTLVGHISSISEYYEDEATGELLPRKRPLVTLTDVHVPDGGWGTIPKGDSQTISKTKRTLRPVAPTVDKTPVTA